MKQSLLIFFGSTIIVLGLGLLSFTNEEKRPDKASHPNIVLILADDLGYGDLSSYGQTQWQTPNIDKLAAQGAKLTDFYTPTPYCAPTRASLLTGRYPIRHGMTANPNPEKVRASFQTYRGGDDVGIADNELLLSEVLKSAGYATKIIGKWHLGHKPQFFPSRHGFDEYYGIPYSNDMRPVVLMENDKVIEYPVLQTTITKRYTQKALEFIDKNKDKPFFLYLPHAMPHKPMAVSEEFYTPDTKGDLYADAVRELDWSVGEVMKKLQEYHLEENTIVIFLSDNGPWFGGSSGGLRGMKTQNWEGGIRVPFIVQWKGHIKPGHVSKEPAGVIDVFPTLTKLAGIPLPKDHVLDGKDIFPLCVSNAKTPHDALFSFYTDKLYTVRSGKWKLHIHSPESAQLPSDSTWIDPRSPDGVTIIAPFEQAKANQFPGVKTGDPAGEGLLFDLEKDPSEQKNIAASYPDIVEKLRKKASVYSFQ
ncbi:sulfatase [Xanthocytophaga agilis]|uniref:Sulfatase n=1 Tax=Xanthocytophaga agilis TaxID=3048010 RepID=A0AAE3UEG5_9BACT|nr:sulfatase [Xanthocytophaga agilis]MDJ1501346.1 sulfatase [Xanthocytophaga agilis]